MKKIIFFFGFLVLLLSADGFAKNEEYDPLSKPLGLLEVIELSLKNNPQTKQAWTNIDISRAEYKQELSDYYPKFDLDATYAHTKKDYNKYSRATAKTETFTPAVSLTYLLYDFGARGASVKEFKYKLNSVEYEKNKTLQTIIYLVVDAYYELFSSMATEKAEKETERSSLEAYKAASLRYKLGLVPLTDKLQAETAYAQNQLTRQRAENDVKIKMAELNYLLNLDPSQKIKLKTPDLKIAESSFEESVESFIDKALKHRPDLYSEKMLQKSAEQNLKSAKRDRYPSVSVTGSYSEVDDLRSSNLDYANSSMSVGVSMPLFQGGYIRNSIAKAKRQLEYKKYKIEDLEKSIKLDVWETYQNFKTAKLNYNTSKKLLQSAKQSEETTLGMYKNGKASILDLLNAQSDLANARKEFISSQYGWFTAKADLARAIGFSDLVNVEEIKRNN